MNTCKLTSQLIAHNYLSFLTAVSREDRRLGFPPLFDNCPPKSRNKERQKKIDFFRLCIKRQKAEKTRENSSFSFFAISEIRILLKKVGALYIEHKS